MSQPDSNVNYRLNVCLLHIIQVIWILWLINSCLVPHVEEKAKLKKLQMEEKKKNAAFRAKVSL